MDFEFNAGAKRMEKQQKKLKEAAKRKLEAERRARERAAERHKVAAEKAKVLREQREQRLLEEEEKKLEEERRTAGISLKMTLQATPSTNEGDKMTLPASCLKVLNPQGAMDLGVMTFEVCSDFGTRTHAGVLEFSAPEGTVGLPPKVARSLCRGHKLSQLKQVTIKYVRMSRGTFAKLQPMGEGFRNSDINFKSELERTLRTHTTLTEGDLLQVRHQGNTFTLGVRALQPEPQVIVINTDVEVDIMVSEAAEAAALEEAERERRLQEEQLRQRDEAERMQREQQQKQEELDSLRARATAALPMEPQAQVQGGVIKVQLRFPGGLKASRRFLFENSLQALFDFAMSSGSVEPPFRLISSFPRRTIHPPSTSSEAISIRDAGLNSRQESLFVEPERKSEQAETEGGEGRERQQQGSSGDSAIPPPSVISIPSPLASPAAGSSRRQSSVPESPVTPNSIAWAQAEEQVARKLDQGTSQSSIQQVQQPLLPGFTPARTVQGAATPEEKWVAQLSELSEMGFWDIPKNISLLERYKGRMVRVVNALSGFT